MKLGLIPAHGALEDPSHAVDLAQLCEGLGLESLWCVEEVRLAGSSGGGFPYSDLPPGELPLPDPIAWLAYVAGATRRIRLGAGLLALPQRSPVLLAKQLATLDNLSGGRLELGIGVGWLCEAGRKRRIPFEPPALRVEEYVAALRTLWRESEASYSGRHVHFARVHGHARPFRGTLPVTLAAHTDDGSQRAGRIADGFMPIEVPWGEIPHLVSRMRASAEAAGRESLPAVTCVSELEPGEIKRCAELGAARVLVVAPDTPLDELEARLRRALPDLEARAPGGPPPVSMSVVGRGPTGVGRRARDSSS